MRISSFVLDLYRNTIKRVRPAHLATHWLMAHGAFPLLEAVTGFRTMPDDPFWFRLELLTGRYECETAAQLDRAVHPGMVLLDVGAHVGYYARRYAKTLGENGRVFAFEPHPEVFAVLDRNVRRFANVTPVPVALAEAAGTAELHDRLLTSASGSLRADPRVIELQRSLVAESDVAPRNSARFVGRTYAVRTTTLDAYLEEQRIERVDVVKMDIEGAEIGALRGMRRTIARSPGLVLVLEYNPVALRAFGHDPERALVEVLGLGFRRVRAIERGGELSDLTHDGEKVRRLTRRLASGMGVVNLLFTAE